MLRPRIIPCLLVRDGGLVKTVGFEEGKYVGDPFNAVRIFNEKEVDELIVLDIDATAEGREPDYQLIRHIATESRMPLCYGGGIKTVEQACGIIGLGVEKVAVSSAAVESPALIGEVVKQLGSQSVVVVLDVRKNSRGDHEVWTHNGRSRAGRVLEELAVEAQQLGAGEIIVNSIDTDGQMEGYDFGAARKLRNVTSVPLTILGGAGSLNDIEGLFSEFGVIGAAAGSLFVFRGAYKAVLINYPSIEERKSLMLAGTKGNTGS